MQKPNFEKLEKILNIKVKDKDLFLTAFTHRSYLNEHSTYELPSNERLEFLGDAVLQLLSSEHLFKNYPNPEGDLTNFRAAIVCTESLALEAGRLGYGEFLLLSKGEEASGGRDREYILANTFESVLGAIFLQEGLEKCREFVEKELFYKVSGIIDNKSYKDAKSEFQEKAQEKLGVTPSYVVLDSWGPDHERIFKVGVYLSREEYGVGEGASKSRTGSSFKSIGQAKFLLLESLRMSVTIRLARVGKKNAPAYKVVVSNTKDKRTGKYLDVLGFYNPSEGTKAYKIDKEKFQEWKNKGALSTDSVDKLLEGTYQYKVYAPKKAKAEAKGEKVEE